MSRSKLIGREWTQLPLPHIIRIALEQALDTDLDQQVIAAGKRSKTFAEQLQGIKRLRREGFTIE